MELNIYFEFPLEISILGSSEPKIVDLEDLYMHGQLEPPIHWIPFLPNSHQTCIVGQYTTCTARKRNYFENQTPILAYSPYPSKPCFKFGCPRRFGL